MTGDGTDYERPVYRLPIAGGGRGFGVGPATGTSAFRTVAARLRTGGCVDLPAAPLVVGLLLVLAAVSTTGVLGSGADGTGNGPAVQVVDADVEYVGLEATAARVRVRNSHNGALLAAVTVSLHTDADEVVAVARRPARVEPGVTTVAVRFDEPVHVRWFESVRVTVTSAVRDRPTGPARTP